MEEEEERRYKSGYVWQDLADDELITPISDNEYVLKGSEISSKTDVSSEIFSSDEGQNHTPASKTSPKPQHVEIDSNISSDPNQESSEALPPPPPPSLSSPDVSDDSAISASIMNTDLWKKHPEQEEKDHEVKEECIPRKEGSENESLRKNKSHSKRTSWLLRNLFRCEGAREPRQKIRL
ncbi:uncharacterized protein LOC109820952 [Asparagus officinalis]|uniref:uncharacterized protein LOC109820952 n=1 Tax=Asparagus officinalis TaxID=4686 RepID=UPI00098E3BE6|nr:uncharacterized protein LOC109820952 [Asparagus officinalis]